MKLYAIVIGRKGKNTRYVAYHPNSSDAISSKHPLAVYSTLAKAKTAKKEILESCDHNDVFVINFQSQ